MSPVTAPTPPRPSDAALGSGPEPVLLIIADISGYTRFMTANAKTLAHSQTIITELVTAIVQQVELPLEVAKLEGDAVFLYCRKQSGPQLWPEVKRLIGEKLLSFFRRFSDKVAELRQSTTCSCHACAHIDRLRLKLIVHSGEVLFHRVLHFMELAGVDVIIAHRLLKNSVASDQYILVTAAAQKDLQFPSHIQWKEGSETYEDLGSIPTWLHLPDGAAPSPSRAAPSFAQRFRRSAKLYCKLWFSPLRTMARRYQRSFRHVDVNSGAGRRASFAAFTLILTPFFLPVGILMALGRALKPPPSRDA